MIRMKQRHRSHECKILFIIVQITNVTAMVCVRCRIVRFEGHVVRRRRLAELYSVLYLLSC